ncbi:MAG: leucyl/phenylalanyl-tRNA--protein transferase [Woeseiaceae bacterium]|nr:leucyl/phenylalanyl-tRNA--protein transferase [Woeseiaceae bacterium]
MRSNRIVWLTPEDPPGAFPDVASAMREPDGLLAAGGDLTPERLLYAYRHGIFPWYDAGQPVLWWSPDPRCVLRPEKFHLSRRLRRTLPNLDETLTFNTAFADVIRACAGPRRSEQGTWITPEMINAYETLHEDGWAHSVEVRVGNRLVGGIYGLAIGKVFFGESMFSHETNASKLAMLGLCSVLRRHDFALIDCQVVSSHLLTIGAETIPRRDFAAILASECALPDRFDDWPDAPVAIRDLESEDRDRSLQ